MPVMQKIIAKIRTQATRRTSELDTQADALECVGPLARAVAPPVPSRPCEKRENGVRLVWRVIP